MRYKIHYACLSHIGKVRSINQDNFICDGHCMKIGDTSVTAPICGKKKTKHLPLFGIFDGMGGEECGEIAAYIASQTASVLKIGEEAFADLSAFCQQANTAICNYAAEHEISAMGTTAALLAFTKEEVVLCNIGDSKIFRLRDGILKQISKDHIAVSAFGVKPPLLQNLGIPPEELVIEPYLARGSYNNGDIYLICSDGLTDMVSVDEITNVLVSKPIKKAIKLLLDRALENGGKDNTTIILCKVKH